MTLIGAPTCARLHFLSKVSFRDLKRRSGKLYEHGGCCDGCRTPLKDGDDVYHCDACSYDLCTACLAKIDTTIKCPVGHDVFRVTLAELKKRPGSLYTHGGYCDGCRAPLKEGIDIYHCNGCNYDLCPSCKKNLEQAQKQTPANNNERPTCMVCYSAPIDSVCFPCGHACMCYQCSQDWNGQCNICPYCRGTCQSVVRLIFPT